MDSIRKGQIAVILFKHQLREKGVWLRSNFRQEVENVANVIGISTDEAMEFMEGVVRELVDETFKSNTRGHDSSFDDAEL